MSRIEKTGQIIPGTTTDKVPGHPNNFPIGTNSTLPLRSPHYGNMRDRSGNKDVKANERWGIRNFEFGGMAKSALNASFLSGIVSDYITTFFDGDDGNTFTNVTGKLFGATALSNQGIRDYLMYNWLYAKGANVKFTSQEALDPNQAMLNGKVADVDDFEEDLMRSVQKDANGNPAGDWFTIKLWKASAACARVKPIVYAIAGFLPEPFKNLIFTIFEAAPNTLWRWRFFSNSLIPNFGSTMLEVIGKGTMGIFNSGYRNDFGKTLDIMHQTAQTYFKGKNGESFSSDKSKAGLYFSMCADRLKEHWQGAMDPTKRLQEKIDKGILQESEVYITDENGEKKESIYSRYSSQRQRLDSITDLTGAFCALGGLLSLSICDPLKIIFQFAGIEKGMNIINGFGCMRRGFTMINYFTRFTTVEYMNSLKYRKEIKAMMDRGEEVGDVAKLFYRAQAKRRFNAGVGMLSTVGNLAEPFLHFFSSDKKLNQLLLKIISRFNLLSITGFFSARREMMGEEKFLTSVVEQHLNEGLKLGEAGARQFARCADLSTEDIHRIAKDRMGDFPEDFNPVVNWVGRAVNKLTDMLVPDSHDLHEFRLAS